MAEKRVTSIGPAVVCGRCGAHCKVAERRDPYSKPFRRSAIPEGICASCVMTEFLYNTYPVNMQIDEAGPELLLKPGIAEAFVSSGLLDECDMDIEEVNWRCVVQNWKLPVKIKKSALNPYRMGDSSRRKEAREKYLADQQRAFEELTRPSRVQ